MPARSAIAWCRESGEKNMNNQKSFYFSLAIAFLLIITLFEKVYAKTPEPLKLPPAPVIAVVLNCSFRAGWCSKECSVMIMREDQALPISAIAGTRNGVDFYCNDASCPVPLALGGNYLIYWSISPSGELSEKKALSIHLNSLAPRAFIHDDKPLEESTLLDRSLSIEFVESTALAQYKTVVNPGSAIQDPDRFRTIKANTLTGVYLPEVMASIDKKAIPLSWERENIDTENIYLALFHAHMFITPFFAGKNDASNREKYLADNTSVENKNLSVLMAFTTSLEKTTLFTIKTHRVNTTQPNPASLFAVKEEFSAIMDESAPKVTIEQQKSIAGKITFAGDIFESVSDISSLMINFGRGWLPVTYEKNKWAIAWDTEVDDISGGEYYIQLRSRDLAGNQTNQSQKITVINHLWPLLALCSLILMLGFTSAFDPRRRQWIELTDMLREGIALQKMDLPEENR